VFYFNTEPWLNLVYFAAGRDIQDSNAKIINSYWHQLWGQFSAAIKWTWYRKILQAFGIIVMPMQRTNEHRYAMPVWGSVAGGW